MNAAWLASIGLLMSPQNGDAAALCRIDGTGITFLKELRFIPYDARIMDEKWAADEPKGRYPIANLFGHAPGNEEGDFLVAAYAADGFEATLEATGRPYRFKLLGIRWGDARSGMDKFDDGIIKYSAKNVSYIVDFNDATKCQDGATVDVDVIVLDTLVEKIHFRVVDMTNEKDYWFDER